MNLAISNFAYDKEDEDEMFSFLREVDITNIEGVLNMIYPWVDINEYALHKFREKLELYGLKMPSLQSIFFGGFMKSLNDEKEVFDHFIRVRDYAKILGAKTLVLGSPVLRKDYDHNKISCLFWRMRDHLAEENMKLLIEPNSRYYRGEYWYTVDEIVEFLYLQKLRYNFGTMIDTHNVKLEHQSVDDVLNRNIEWIDHIHVSELFLESIDYVEFHKTFAGTLKKNGYKNYITYEVSKNAKNLQDGIIKFKEIYSTVYQKNSPQQ